MSKQASKSTGERTRVTMNLPTDLLRTAKHYAVDADMDLQDVVASALRTYLRQGKRAVR